MELLNYLKERMATASTISDVVCIFEEMCKIPVDPEQDDLLFETGVFQDYLQATDENSNENSDSNAPTANSRQPSKSFLFALVRQFRQNEDDDEFTQLRLEIRLKPELWNKLLYATIWSDGDSTAFFQKVRSSLVYKHIEKHNLSILNHRIFLMET